ncbi:hypothetical protein J2Z69_001660 [Paenibacillus shirakamiensis]|uniref:Uncharacterized protein n=1 Tax=Paenibacillus shirakamiensis TaxID=1265935 RepID=A0ABS4JFZ5_9BACL|nr:hypothetical protein [Paenibacillus shirakamiensis]
MQGVSPVVWLTIFTNNSHLFSWDYKLEYFVRQYLSFIGRSIENKNVLLIGVEYPSHPC